MKHKRKDRPVKKNIAIPQSIVSRVDEQLRDPFTNRPRFGTWAALVTGLLVKWLNGEVKVTVPLKKVVPFCPKCLLDTELHHTCKDTECPMRKINEQPDGDREAGN
ncbi:hypothetical protein LCGC14_2667730 [marine sediment metagenome]|uniref:Uncharacterized protein n=1 Tax=marine sediment metagenome TaxID=412755 RepID=A0A0F9CGY3_9ZZZZ